MIKMRFYTKMEDLIIIQNAHTSKTFDDIGKELNRPPFQVYWHAKNRFGIPHCNNHKSFQKGCKECLISMEKWKKNSLELIKNLQYNNPNRSLDYSKPEDKFILEHAYNDLNFFQISESLGRFSLSAHQRMKSQFGLPKCENHRNFDSNCKSCSTSLLIWREESLKKIKDKKYRTSSVYNPEEKNIKRRKKILHRTSQYIQLLTEEIYYGVIEFLLNSGGLLKGRSIETVFVQVARLFITDFIRSLNLSEVIPYEVLEFFFSHTPNNTIINNALPIYKEKINPNYHSMHDLVKYTLRDIKNLEKIYPKEFCNRMWLYLCLLNLKFGNRMANLAAIIYIQQRGILKKNPPNIDRISQKELTKYFETNAVTLRDRIKELQAKHFPQNIFTFNRNTIEFHPERFWLTIKGVHKKLEFKQLIKNNNDMMEILLQQLEKYDNLEKKYQSIIEELEKSQNNDQYDQRISNNLSDIKLNVEEECIVKLGKKYYISLFPESKKSLSIALFLLKSKTPILYHFGVLELSKIIELEIARRLMIPFINYIKNKKIRIFITQPLEFNLSKKELNSLESIKKTYCIFSNWCQNEPKDITLGTIPYFFGRLAEPEKYQETTNLFFCLRNYMLKNISQQEINILKNFLNNKDNILNLPSGESISSLRNYVAHPFNPDVRNKINIDKEFLQNYFDIMNPQIIRILLKIE